MPTGPIMSLYELCQGRRESKEKLPSRWSPMTKLHPLGPLYLHLRWSVNPLCHPSNRRVKAFGLRLVKDSYITINDLYSFARKSDDSLTIYSFLFTRLSEYSGFLKTMTWPFRERTLDFGY